MEIECVFIKQELQIQEDTYYINSDIKEEPSCSLQNDRHIELLDNQFSDNKYCDIDSTGSKDSSNVGKQTELSEISTLDGNVIRYQCNQCRKGFKFRSILERHLVTHSSLKQHRCQHCMMEFNRLDNLKSHLMTHMGIKPHQCELCEKEFKRASDLKRHLSVHRGETPFQCRYCKKEFNRPSDLKRHFNTHRNVISQSMPSLRHL